MIRSSVSCGRSIRCTVIVPLLLLQEDNESLVEVQEENMKYLPMRRNEDLLCESLSRIISCSEDSGRARGFRFWATTRGKHPSLITGRCHLAELRLMADRECCGQIEEHQIQAPVTVVHRHPIAHTDKLDYCLQANAATNNDLFSRNPAGVVRDKEQSGVGIPPTVPTRPTGVHVAAVSDVSPKFKEPPGRALEGAQARR